MKRVFLLLGAAISMSFVAAPSRSETADESRSRKLSGWLVGAGYASAPDPYADQVKDASHSFPLIGYSGKRVRWFGPKLSYEIADRGPFRADAVAEVRFEGIEEDVDRGPLAGIRARKPWLDAGVDLGWGPLYASGRLDVSGRNDGYEVSMGLGKKWLLDGWQVQTRAGARWQSAALTSYLYGIDASEAQTGLNLYEPGSALSPEASLGVSRAFGRWLGFANATMRWLDDEIRASPLVEDDRSIGLFTGFAYQLGSAGQR